MSNPEFFHTTRRSFFFFGLLALSGCVASKSQQALRSPEPVWPDVDPGAPPGQWSGGSRSGSGSRTAGGNVITGPRNGAGTGTVGAGGAAAGRGSVAGAGGGSGAGASTLGLPAAEALGKGPVPFAYKRQSWARGAPVAAKLNPMLPPKWVTVHHDGMEPYFATDLGDTRMRLETIRNGAMSRGSGWGDIPYHFVIDRAGRVWEGRSLRYQGAHVASCNEHNVGVMCMGNFEEQQPSAAQIAGLEKTLAALRAYYKVPMSKVRTHREWPTAHTACPGKSLQARMVAIRKGSNA